MKRRKIIHDPKYKRGDLVYFIHPETKVIENGIVEYDLFCSPIKYILFMEYGSWLESKLYPNLESIQQAHPQLQQGLIYAW